MSGCKQLMDNVSQNLPPEINLISLSVKTADVSNSRSHSATLPGHNAWCQWQHLGGCDRLGQGEEGGPQQLHHQQGDHSPLHWQQGGRQGQFGSLHMVTASDQPKGSTNFGPQKITEISLPVAERNQRSYLVKRGCFGRKAYFAALISEMMPSLRGSHRVEVFFEVQFGVFSWSLLNAIWSHFATIYLQSTLIHRMLEREEAAKPTLALEYTFGRKSNLNLSKVSRGLFTNFWSQENIWIWGMYRAPLKDCS